GDRSPPSILLRAENAEGLLRHHIPAREDPDANHYEDRQSNGKKIVGRQYSPPDLKDILADGPAERDRRSRSDQPRQETQHAILDQYRIDDLKPIGSESLEYRRL